MSFSAIQAQLFGAAGLLGLAVAAGAQTFAVETIDGRSFGGSLTMTDGGPLRVATAQASTEIGLADVLSIRRVEPVAMAVRAAPCEVWLRSGTRLVAASVAGGEASGTMAVELPGGAVLSLPITSIAAMRTHTMLPETFAADLADPRDNKDYLYVVKDGAPQRFSVEVAGVRDGQMQFQLRDRSFSYPLTGEDRVVGVVFGRNRGFAPDRQPRPRIRIATSSGEQIEGRLTAVGRSWTVSLDEGSSLPIDAREVVQVDVLTEKLTWLSDLQPRVEQTPAFDKVWPWQVNRTPAGPGLRMHGRDYGRGLCLVPRTRLTYELDGRFDVLEATIGIDDRGGPQAHAIFRVYGDGELLFESEPKTPNTLPEQIKVALNRCRQVAVEADFGKHFDLGDFCVFANLRVVQR